MKHGVKTMKEKQHGSEKNSVAKPLFVGITLFTLLIIYYIPSLYAQTEVQQKQSRIIDLERHELAYQEAYKKGDFKAAMGEAEKAIVGFRGTLVLRQLDS